MRPPLLSALLTLAACALPAVAAAQELHYAPHPLSNHDAKVTVLEFVDLQCPSCKNAEKTLNAPLLKKYGERIRFEMRHFPLTALHRYALDAAIAAECAGQQNRQWEYVGKVFESQTTLSKPTFPRLARTLRMDLTAFQACQRAPWVRAAILRGVEKESATVFGTPTYRVNGKTVTATLEDLGKAIDSAIR